MDPNLFLGKSKYDTVTQDNTCQFGGLGVQATFHINLTAHIVRYLHLFHQMD